MTFDDLYRSILDICPNAEMGEDNDGQLVVYTGMREAERVLGEPREVQDMEDFAADVQQTPED